MHARAAMLPLVFGFTPSNQLDLVAGDLSGIEPSQRTRVRETVDRLASRVMRTRTVVGAATQLGGGSELVLLTIPVNELEAASGRGGLSVTLGALTLSKARADVDLYLQLVTALKAAIAAACDRGSVLQLSPEDSMRSVAETFARGIQQTDGQRLVDDLNRLVGNLTTLFSLLLSTPLRSRDKGSTAYRRGGHELSADPPYVLCRMLVTQLRLYKSGQLAHFVDLDGAVDTQAVEKAPVTEHLFLGSRLFLCQQIAI